MRLLTAAVIAVTAAAAALAACNSSKSSNSSSAGNAAPSSDYVEDVRRICNAEQLSGALEQDPNGRSMFVANWLANNLVTQDGRDLMGKQAALEPAAKAELLRAEAKEAGLAECPTADTWGP
jgi:hypothetical protein